MTDTPFHLAGWISFDADDQQLFSIGVETDEGWYISASPMPARTMLAEPYPPPGWLIASYWEAGESGHDPGRAVHVVCGMQRDGRPACARVVDRTPTMPKTPASRPALGLEREVYPDPHVARKLAGYRRLFVDVSEDREEHAELTELLDAETLPSVQVWTDAEALAAGISSGTLPPPDVRIEHLVAPDALVAMLP